jgi:hypothetical protein
LVANVLYFFLSLWLEDVYSFVHSNYPPSTNGMTKWGKGWESFILHIHIKSIIISFIMARIETYLSRSTKILA